jgi:hypothetical protein
MFIHCVIWLLQIFVTRGGNKKYASVLAPGQLDGLKYYFLLYSFLIGTRFFCSVIVQVIYALTLNIFVIFIIISIWSGICHFSNVPPLHFIYLGQNTLIFSMYEKISYYPVCWTPSHHNLYTMHPCHCLFHWTWQCLVIMSCMAYFAVLICATYGQMWSNRDGKMWEWQSLIAWESFVALFACVD